MKDVGKHLRNQWAGVLALFLVLTGGTAWAATSLTKNSVRSGHIVNGQVKSVDLADGGVTRADVRKGAFAPARAEAWHDVAPYQDGSTEAGRFRGTSGSCYQDDIYRCYWHNRPYAPAHETAAFYRDPYGRVHLKGFVCRHEYGATCSPNTVVGSDDIFQLPAGYRPSRMIEVATVSGGQFGRVEIAADGTVSAAPPFNYVSLSLENISFRCAPAGQDGCP